MLVANAPPFDAGGWGDSEVGVNGVGHGFARVVVGEGDVVAAGDGAFAIAVRGSGVAGGL